MSGTSVSILLVSVSIVPIAISGAASAIVPSISGAEAPILIAKIGVKDALDSTYATTNPPRANASLSIQ